MHIIPAVFIAEDLAISRHQYRDGICEQQHPRRDSARGAINTSVPHSRIFEIDGIHQMMQSDVGVASAHARQHWCHQSQKRIQRIAPKCAKKQIEPDYVRLYLSNRFKDTQHIQRVVKGPAAHHGKIFQLRLGS